MKHGYSEELAVRVPGTGTAPVGQMKYPVQQNIPGTAGRMGTPPVWEGYKNGYVLWYVWGFFETFKTMRVPK